MKRQKVELLAPAGNKEKFYTALHFGADAVYMAGKDFGLRAFSDNFTVDEIAECAAYAHTLGKKVYITVNIYGRNDDVKKLPDYVRQLKQANVDAVLVSDCGIFDVIKETEPTLPIHISTQANTTNAAAVRFWAKMGAERVVLARELSLDEIKEIATEAEGKVDIEAFVHGAMCISMSGRCLLSNYLSNRDGNRGECVQACRWEYEINEVNRKDEKLGVSQDSRATYFLNSKDMNLLGNIDKLIDAGIDSLKIEGRMKSPFYVATVVNAYRRAIDAFYASPDCYKADEKLLNELELTSHRQYTTGFYFGDYDRQCYETSKPKQIGVFIASVIDCADGFITAEQRNRFKKGDRLQVLSADENFLKEFVVEEMFDQNGNAVDDAKVVQQILKIKCPYTLQKYDILRK